MIVYKTTNLINGKFYIGKDSKNDPNYYGSGILIKKAIKKYGINNFKKETLSVCNSIEELNATEIYWIYFFKSQNSDICYNIANGGDGGDTLSNHPNKIAIFEKCKRTGNEHWHFGQITKDETKESIKESINKYYAEHPEAIESQSIKMKGKYIGDKNPMYGKGEKVSGHKNGRFGGKGTTDETREKIREARKNAGPVTDETRQKLSDKASGINNAMYGRSAYDIWVEKYGKDEADKRKEETRKRKIIAAKKVQERKRMK